MTNRSPERAQMYQDILTTGIESGYPWFRYDDIVRTDDLGYESATVEEIEETGDHSADVTPRGTVNVETIAKAFGILRKGPVKYLHESVRRRFLGMYDVPDDADFDVNDADTLLQLGILGEIKYG